MAHGMLATDRMYSVRVAPWHISETGDRTLVLDSAPEKRAERMDLAGHSWTVEESDVYRKMERMDVYGPDTGRQVTFPKVPGWKMLTRSDNGDMLNVARDSYTIVQNVVGHELFEALSDGAVLDDGTGGTINGGATCYLSARLDEPWNAPDDESPTYPYVVVTWAHDGSGALQARATNVRVVCWNTLSASEAQSARTGRRYTFRHTAKVSERIDEAKRALAGVREEHAAFREIVEDLATLRITPDIATMFVQEFIPEPVARVVSERVRANVAEARARVESILNGETVPAEHKLTGYGLLLAGTEYLDHVRGYRSRDTYLGRTLLREESLKTRLVPMIRDLVK